MKQSDSIAKLAAALVLAQRKLEPMAKSATNRFNKKYASLDTITEAVRPVLAEVGLVVVQGATLPTTDADGRLTAFTLETMLIHESGEWLINGVVFPVGTTPVKDKAGNIVGAEATAQNAGATVTYGRRYGLAALLALTTDEDDDGDRASSHGNGGASSTTAAAPQRKPAPAKAAPAAAKPKVKAADRMINVGSAENPDNRRLGDMTVEELTKLRERASGADPKRFADLLVAIDEVLEEKRGTDDDLPF